MGLLATGVILLIIAGPRGTPIQLDPLPTLGPVCVHVAGCVEQAGVYHLPRGSIVEAAVVAAGGPRAEADTDQINLAEELQDGQRIFVPCRNATPIPEIQSSSIETAARLNINTATAAELELLPGIGPSLAECILAYRADNGPFTSIDQLLNVRGIGPSKLAQIENLITLD